MKYERITFDNLELACKIQNELFPEEDARENFIEQINKAPYRKEMDYRIVYLDNEPIGITGIYAYHEYPNEAWLGWFGILKQFRNKGYGKKVLEDTMKYAKEKGYTIFRLYTDEFLLDAQRLYEKMGFIKELYDREDDQSEYSTAETYVYSKSLTDKEVELWNNRLIGLKEQSIKENMYK